MILSALLSIPVLGFLLMLQMAIFSRLPLLGGTVDIIFLVVVAWSLQERAKTAWIWSVVGGTMVGMVSALPLFVPLGGYLAATVLSRLLQRRVWQSPILAMFLATAVGTVICQMLSIFGLQLTGVPINLLQSIRLVSMPSALLNLILALPVYALVHDFANWIYPIEVEE